jgi:lauroyl/myristoyl acyltransferase
VVVVAGRAHQSGSALSLFAGIGAGGGVGGVGLAIMAGPFDRAFSFLGKEVTQTPTPAFLARKFNAYIIPVYMEYLDDFKYKIIFKEPFLVEKSSNEHKDIKLATQKQADIFTQIINNNKNLWFWCHKRFKELNNEIYK